MNLYNIPQHPAQEELVERLWQGNDVRVERIVTTGQTSPPGFWYDQKEDEWVAVLSGWGEIELDNGKKIRLAAGETLLLPAHLRHRVSDVSPEPCIWLCVFAKGEGH